MQATFPRQLASEILDNLAEDDPRAIRSRRDIRRINRIMGADGIIADAVERSRRIPRRMIELGAGDGSMMLRLATRLSVRWQPMHLTLLDRQRLVSDETRDAFARLGWSVEVLHADVADWIVQMRQSMKQHWDIAVANLFVHHFDHDRIGAMFEALCGCADLFIACEPRRGHLPLLASRMVGLIGANAVTREDAVLSVRAGFHGRELSDAWPGAQAQWLLEEGPAGLFSHRFVASRRMV